MRLRNVKNKEIILNNSDMVIKYDESYLGNWYSIFKNNNPIEIEIGMGKGQFVINKDKLNTDVYYIGIEIYDSVLARAVEKVDENIPNLKFVRMDAMDINRFFYKEISKIYLNFSDPWPKKRHARRRLTSHDFLSKYDDIFVDSKVICQKTDNECLFAYSIVSLSEYGYIIRKISLDLHNSEINNESTTEYEDKFSSKGQKIYYLEATK